MIKALPIQTDLKPKYYLAKLPSVGIIEDSIFANYKTALEQGDLDQARKAVKFAQELKTMTESGDFVDYPNSSTPEALPPSNFANPFPYKYYESQGVVVMGNAAINLTPKENKLFALFAKNESSGNVIRVITKEQILNCLWATRKVTNNAVRIIVLRLREKIEPDPKQPQIILSSWGKGYIFLGNNEPSEPKFRVN
ncbi:hypothetical protein A3H21_04520 [Candidatus Woesebacteria bacterium RIFCSPLOWO2_12_FULL_42_8]|nr:MAG: hypothetical protein A2W15_05200 [Candidatus Woesebacteria bacterium RBG_16_41_13]OGM72757.1 MAG: hypothetical protein A3H21_04520 [Candidatus Woesebacteria bacterium RIFCSPLOWO2_12_FULL_42_8]